MRSNRSRTTRAHPTAVLAEVVDRKGRYDAGLLADQLDWSQAMMATYLGRDQSTVSRHATSAPVQDELARLAALLKKLLRHMPLAHARAWLRTPLDVLDRVTPQQLIVKGRIRLVERVVDEIKRRSLAWGVGAASVAEIERFNIRNATHLAMRRALRRLPRYDHVLVDGLKIRGFEEHIGPYTAIVDGDESSYAIACASVVAKVTRDRLMARLALRYPGYGWERNRGYGTSEHARALRELGPSAEHRRSYAPIRAILAGNGTC